MNKKRFVALTDIYRLPGDRQKEIDDVQSMIRLLLYADNIDLEGLIATTSFCFKNGGTQKEKQVILDIIDGYEKVLPNLRVHSSDYPDANYLRSITMHGIPEFGAGFRRGFGHAKYNENEGVKQILRVLEKEDDRPVWFGLWGGCNTLAHAVWLLESTHTPEEFDRLLKKIRIYGISDQDRGGIWLRRRYRERLFYVVSPSNGSGIVLLNGMGFMNATWTGMCWDGGKMADHARGFEAADINYLKKEWLLENICGEGAYQKLYPLPIQAMEGDTPTFLGLINNGLNEMEHPDWGSWGGRYDYRLPEKTPPFTHREKAAIWTDTEDLYTANGVTVKNSVCTLYRWRKDFQLDFASRMQWTLTGDFAKANHAPVVKTSQPQCLLSSPGETVILSAADSYDPDGDALTYEWFSYPEAGDNPNAPVLKNAASDTVSVLLPMTAGSCHVILRVTDNGKPSMCSYARFILTVQ